MKVSVGFSIIFLLLVSSCRNDPVSMSYPEEVNEIIINSCAVEACHTADAPPEGLDLSTWHAAFEGSDFGAIVIPYNPQWSHLFQHLNTFQDLGIRATPVMPPSPQSNLSREEVLLIKEWIERGAPDANGLIQWQENEQNGRGKLFALAASSDLVAVANLDKNLVMRLISVGTSESDVEAPHFIRISPDKQYFYVTLIRGTAVEKYRTDTYEKVGRVEVGPDPALIQISPDGKRVLISHYNDTEGTAKLSLIDAENMEILDEVIGGGQVLSFPHGMATTADFSTLYVVAGQGNYYAKVNIEDDTFVPPLEQISVDPANAPIPQPSLRYKPYHCYLDEANQRFFISCSASDEVRIFDTSTDALVGTISTGEFPRLMDYDPLEGHLYVACANQADASQGSRLGCVSVIDVNSEQLITNIFGLGHRPHGVSLDLERKRLYVSSENTGGVDPPHHPTTDVGPPGKYNVVDLRTFEVLEELETEIPVFPNALVVNK